VIAGFSQNGHAIEALNLFCQMQLTDVVPNEVTIVGVLQACAHLATLHQAKRIHGYIIRSEFDSNVYVATALIDMYAKCGRINIARQLFEKMSTRDVVTWNAMIAGYGMHGYGEDAFASFKRMQLTGMKPDHITFAYVLCACCHAGLVDDGWQIFESMSQEYYYDYHSNSLDNLL
jgi:pentatricopeptide repeat protein